MSALEIIATVLIGAGLLLAVVAAVGLNRFDGVLMRIHAASKPQTLGLMFVFTGVALVAQSWSLAGFLLVVLLAQMGTVPVASVMVGRAARSEEHTSELQSRGQLVCRLLLEKKNSEMTGAVRAERA